MKNIYKIFTLTLFSLLIVHSTLYIEQCEAQWQPDVRLTNASDTSITNINNTKHIASSGNYVYAVWTDQRDGDKEIYFKRSTNSGTDWGQDVRLTNAPGNSAYSCVAASNSLVHVFWTDNRYGLNQIYYRRSSDNGLTWNFEARISSDTVYSNSGPSIAVSGLNLYAFWHTNYSGNPEITFKKSTDGGLSWGQEIRLTNSSGFSIWASPAVSYSTLNVTWWDNRGGNYDIYYKRSTDGGTSWDIDSKLSSTTGNASGSCISASDSNVYVVWYDNRDGNSEIYFKRSADLGLNWGADTRLTNDISNSFYPSITSSGSLIHIVWHDIRTAYYEIFYKSSTDRGLTWSTDTSLTNAPGSSLYPTVCLSGSMLHLLWTDDRDGNLEVYYKNNPTGNPIGINLISKEVPLQFNLFQNYPNPFNPGTVISYSVGIPSGQLVVNSFVTLKVFDNLGREIETLIDGLINPGTYQVKFDGTNYPSGVYFYQLVVSSEQLVVYKETKKMVLVK